MSNDGDDVVDWFQLGVWFGLETAQDHLDPDDPLEVAVRVLMQFHHARIGDLVQGWAALLERAGDDEELFLDPLQPLSPVPAGGSWLQWGRYVSTILGRVAVGEPEFPKDRPNGRGQGRPTPVTRFLDQRLADQVVTEMLARQAPAFRRWCTDPVALPRLHLHSEFDHPVGQAFAREQPSRGVPAAGVAVTGCAVLVGRSGSAGDAEVLAAYPEPTFADRGARQRWPDLPVLFGGYFGQRYRRLDGNTWAAERALNEQLSHPVRIRLGAQLAELLEVDDRLLAGTLRELGSYVVPPDPRRWVSGLRRRMLDVDWSQPAAEGTARQEAHR